MIALSKAFLTVSIMQDKRSYTMPAILRATARAAGELGDESLTARGRGPGPGVCTVMLVGTGLSPCQ